MIKKLIAKIENANILYRTGNSIISDKEYDILIEELEFLDPDNELLNKIGVSIDDCRKTILPIIMASMSKVKTIQEIKDWLRTKGISTNELVIFTPKFDGLSLMVCESNGTAITRGDGTYGSKSNEHYSFIKNHLSLKDNPFKYTFGEVIIPKKVFLDKYSMDFANPRNLVAGLINSKTVDNNLIDSLKDCQYIKYGAVSDSTFKTKKEIIDLLNKGQKEKVNYHICKISELTEDLLIGLFHKWKTEYEIDGVIIEINDISLQNKLGRENSSNNPVWSRAFKHSSFEDSSEADIINIVWSISKNGLLKPVAQVTPINVGGVVISNCTLNNAKFVKENGLGIGSRVLITRSGGVIPKIIKVINGTGFEMPVIEGIDIGWNDNEVELITLEYTEEQDIKKLISFFEILEADNVGPGVISQLYDDGYMTIKDILNLKISDLEKINRFGKRKASIVFNSIKKSVTDVQLSKIQHASGFFVGLGSRKLILLEHFTTKPTIDQVMKIEGFAEISAKSYIDGYDIFNSFIKDLPITIEQKSEASSCVNSNELEGKTFCFTGIRLKELENVIIERGGKISSGVSKNLTYLVAKDINSGSSKLMKAKELGVILLNVEDLENMLSN